MLVHKSQLLILSTSGLVLLYNTWKLIFYVYSLNKYFKRILKYIYIWKIQSKNYGNELDRRGRTCRKSKKDLWKELEQIQNTISAHLKVKYKRNSITHLSKRTRIEIFLKNQRELVNLDPWLMCIYDVWQKHEDVAWKHTHERSIIIV